MTADEKIIRGEGQVAIDEHDAAICGEFPGHVYSASKFEACPTCGTTSRLFLRDVLKPARAAIVVGAMLDDPDLSWTGPRAQEWREKLLEAVGQ